MKKEARRLKKVKKAKAISGKLLAAREVDGEGEEDWKESVREQKELRKKNKFTGMEITAGGIEI